MAREVLPNRRHSETFEFLAGPEPGSEISYGSTLGFYPGGRLGELFLRSGKAGTQINVLAIELAVATSLALQYGCPADTIRKSCPHTANGDPEGPVGKILTLLVQAQTADAA